MAFDGLFTAAIVEELQQIKDGRISKIHQPNAQEVVLMVRAGRNNSDFSFQPIHRTHEFS